MIYYLVALTLVTGSGTGSPVKFEGRSYTWQIVDAYESMSKCDRAASEAKKNKSKTRYICAEKDFN